MLGGLVRVFYNEIIPLAKQSHIKRLVVAGDLLTSKYSIPNRISIIIDKIFRELAEHVEVYILIGNHDLIYDNDMTTHSLERFVGQKNTHVLLGGGELDFDGRKIIYHSYSKTSKPIMDWFKENEITGDCFIGHVEQDDTKIIKYVNANFKMGLSGHIHIREEHGNFVYLQSIQEHTRTEIGSKKGYTLVDWESMTHKFVENTHGGKFVTIRFGDEFKQEDLVNNYVDVEIDMAKVREMSSSPSNQRRLTAQFFENILAFENVKIDRKYFKDSEDTTNDEEVEFHDIEDVKRLNFNEELLLRVKELSMEFKEETIERLEGKLKGLGKI